MIEIGIVKKAVYSWSIRFKESVRVNEELLILSEEYLEDLLDEYVSEKEFAFACKEARKKCSFFPKMCDILKYVGEYRTSPPASDTLALEENAGLAAPLTEEQQAINLKRLKILGRISCGEITHEQGAEEMEAP
jgi:hypothetical protein